MLGEASPSSSRGDPTMCERLRNLFMPPIVRPWVSWLIDAQSTPAWKVDHRPAPERIADGP
jgi:hypothetical protein